ncbi:oxalurate catabolism protein HpxZ [Saccharothrix deserti]|uniref:oxalurate catabolism protein HpxZ n=1 Tax=Saccharothrix deserti TaxID=2593674 RepID=UPI00192E5832|nr:oxalurate catabolism protein HpxZ [Saccharothrix deserti]
MSTPDTAVVVDDPAVVAEVWQVFERYEAALVAGDHAVLDELFWSGAQAVRYGIADLQRGGAAIRAWRASQGPLPGRVRTGTTVTTFGADTASVTTLFHYPGRPLVGRQSQTWVRLPEGWRIVSAHVSEIPT